MPAPPAAANATGAKSSDEPKYPTVRLTGVFHLDMLSPARTRGTPPRVGNVRMASTSAGCVSRRSANWPRTSVPASSSTSPRRRRGSWTSGRRSPKCPWSGNVRVGRYRQPFGMDVSTSVRELPFLERPPTFALAPFRQAGVMAFDTFADDDGDLRACRATGTTADPFGNVYTDAGGYGAGRPAHRPALLPGQQPPGPPRGRLQLQPAGRHQPGPLPEPPGSLRRRRRRAACSPPNAVNIPAVRRFGPVEPWTAFSWFNLEAAAVSGNVAVQAEARALVARGVNGNTATLPAYYAEAGTC